MGGCRDDEYRELVEDLREAKEAAQATDAIPDLNGRIAVLEVSCPTLVLPPSL